MTRKQFHQEKSVLVASTEVTPWGTKKYLDKHIREFVARGIYTKWSFLTGCHGKKNGEDGIFSLECLSDTIRKANNRSQTRYFYENWCNFFGLDVEGKDPREYDPTTGQVIGIKNVATPDWAARKAGCTPPPLFFGIF